MRNCYPDIRGCQVTVIVLSKKFELWLFYLFNAQKYLQVK